MNVWIALVPYRHRVALRAGPRNSTAQRTRWTRMIGATVALLGTPIVALLGQTAGTCVPVSERAGREFGCFITSRVELGHLSRRPKLFWYLDTYASRAAANTAVKNARSTVVESLGHVWLFTIAPAGWRAVGGHREARIGPLPLTPATRYAAVYMEGVFQPGMKTVIHRHPGVEAWYTLEGAMCLETPEGTVRQRAGDPGKMVRGGLPMMLTGTGTGPRRSLVLILQDAAKPWLTVASDWTPKGLCESSIPASVSQ
ncbi:MAG: hypothetical protein NVS4B3_22600 [Gemmatimonadaceae bacterium]